MLSDEFCRVFNNRIHFLSRYEKRVFLENNRNKSEYDAISIISKMADKLSIKSTCYNTTLELSIKKLSEFAPFFTKIKGIKNILDIGGADGSLGMAIASILGVEPKNITLLDVNPQPCTEYLEAGLDYKHCSADNLTISDSLYDIAILSMVLHHLDTIEVMEKCLLETYRILKPGGYLFIREHDIHDGNEYTFDLIHLFFRAVLTNESTIDEAFKSKQVYISFDRLKTMLIKIGFNPIGTRIFQHKHNINEAYGFLVQKPT